jgi:hypothetical protein
VKINLSSFYHPTKTAYCTATALIGIVNDGSATYMSLNTFTALYALSLIKYPKLAYAPLITFELTFKKRNSLPSIES